MRHGPPGCPKVYQDQAFFGFCFKCCVCNCFCHFLSPLVLVLRQILLHQIEEDISVSPLVIQFIPIIGQFHNRIKICYPNQAGLLGAFKLFVGIKMHDSFLFCTPSRYVISIISITSISYDASIVTLDITSVEQNDFLRMMDLVR